MIVPPYMLSGGSLEQDVAEWVDGVRCLGFAEDWDGCERPGLAVAISEDLPSNEAPATRGWDIPWSWCVGMANVRRGETPMYWAIGPSTYLAFKRAEARERSERN